MLTYLRNMMIRWGTKKRVLQFVDAVDLLNQSVESQKLGVSISEARELIGFKAYKLIMEKLLTQLQLNRIPISEELILSAKTITSALGMNWNEWKSIEELVS